MSSTQPHPERRGGGMEAGLGVEPPLATSCALAATARSCNAPRVHIGLQHGSRRLRGARLVGLKRGSAGSAEITGSAPCRRAANCAFMLLPSFTNANGARSR